MELVCITHGLVHLGAGHNDKEIVMGKPKIRLRIPIHELVACVFLIVIFFYIFTGRDASLLGASGVGLVSVLATRKKPDDRDGK